MDSDALEVPHNSSAIQAAGKIAGRFSFFELHDRGALNLERHGHPGTAGCNSRSRRKAIEISPGLDEGAEQIGGSGNTTKDRDGRFVHMHPRIGPIVAKLPRHTSHVLLGLSSLKLLESFKDVCVACGLGQRFKVQRFRHFASLCANHQVAHQKALAWRGRSSSDILDLCYHLYDDESQKAM